MKRSTWCCTSPSRQPRSGGGLPCSSMAMLRSPVTRKRVKSLVRLPLAGEPARGLNLVSSGEDPVPRQQQVSACGTTSESAGSRSPTDRPPRSSAHPEGPDVFTRQSSETKPESGSLGDSGSLGAWIGLAGARYVATATEQRLSQRVQPGLLVVPKSRGIIYLIL
jgi:hypothetical protein